jgi:hypothetical protein
VIADGTNSGPYGIPQWRKNFGVLSSRMRFFNILSAKMAFKTFKTPRYLVKSGICAIADIYGTGKVRVRASMESIKNSMLDKVVKILPTTFDSILPAIFECYMTKYLFGKLHVIGFWKKRNKPLVCCFDGYGKCP